MANTVSKDTRWVSQSGTNYPDTEENTRIGKSNDKSTYVVTDGGQSENDRIEYEVPFVSED